MQKLRDVVMAMSAWFTVARNAIAFLGVLIAVLIGMNTWYRSGGLSAWLVVAVAWITSVLAAGVSGGLIYRRVSYRRNSPLGYRWVRASYTYSFDPEDHRRQRQVLEVEIQARRDNVLLFQNQFLWTGWGPEPSLHVNGSRHVILRDPGMRVDNWKFYFVRLERPLMRKQTTVIRIQQELFDEAGEFEPKLSKHVREGMNLLELTVEFPNEMPYRDVCAAYRRSGIVGHPDVLGELKVERNESAKMLSLRIDRPRKNNVYSIEWYWDYPMIDTTKGNQYT